MPHKKNSREKVNQQEVKILPDIALDVFSDGTRFKKLNRVVSLFTSNDENDEDFFYTSREKFSAGIRFTISLSTEVDHFHSGMILRTKYKKCISNWCVGFQVFNRVGISIAIFLKYFERHNFFC